MPRKKIARDLSAVPTKRAIFLPPENGTILLFVVDFGAFSGPELS